MITSRKRKQNSGIENVVTSLARHYNSRDKAVGISPKLTDIDKRNARFSALAYETDVTNINKTLQEKHPGWEVGHSSTTETIFHNLENKEMIFAAKGTNPMSIDDLKSDIELTRKPFQKWDSINRMQDSLESFNEHRSHYTALNYDKFSVTGHSLGGGVALHIAHKTGVPATVFNPSLPITRTLDFIHVPTSRIIRTNYDIVSRGRTAITGGERLTVPVIDGKRDPLSAHKLDHFIDNVPTNTTTTTFDKLSALSDKYSPKVYEAISIASTGAQLVGDIQHNDGWGFVKHSAEAVIARNPFGATAVTGFEYASSVYRDFNKNDTVAAIKDTIEGTALTMGGVVGATAVTGFEYASSVYRDIKNKDTGAAIKDTIEGTALSVGGVFGAPGLLAGAAVAGLTEFTYQALGHNHPKKPQNESMGGASTQPGMAIENLAPNTYTESTSGKADSRAARAGL